MVDKKFDGSDGASEFRHRVAAILCASALVTLAGCATAPSEQTVATPPGSDSPGTFLLERGQVAPGQSIPDAAPSETAADNSIDAEMVVDAVDVETTDETAAEDVPPVGLNFLPQADPVFTSEEPEDAAPIASVPISSIEQGADGAAAQTAPSELPVTAVRPGDPDIWQRILTGYALPDENHPRAVAHRRWYINNRAYLNRTFERARPFLFYIVQEVERRGMPLELALLPVVESAFQPFAYSHGRASGIWQFIPGTAKRYGVSITWWYDGRRDIIASTRAALDYLEDLHKRFDNDWLLALAAYNSGEGTVGRAIRANRKKHKPTDYWNLKLPKETAGYVPRLLAVSHVVRNAAQYKIPLPPIPAQPYLEVVEIDSQIDVALAAELAGLPVDDIYRLNAGLNRWATDPKGPHRLVLPATHVHGFQSALAELPPDKRVRWERHTIASGESLISIAKRYETTPEVIRDTNGLKGNMIRAGQQLIIPVAQRSSVAYTMSEEQRAARTKEQAHGNSKVVHTVKSGESLWTLSRKYKVSTQNIAAWNSMATRDTLKIGQKLVIWQKGGAAPKGATAGAKLAATDVRPPTSKQRIRYTVRKGDSLARIAQRFNTSVASIQKWNADALARKKYLQPGQTLTLYVDAVQAAETS